MFLRIWIQRATDQPVFSIYCYWLLKKIYYLKCSWCICFVVTALGTSFLGEEREAYKCRKSVAIWISDKDCKWNYVSNFPQGAGDMGKELNCEAAKLKTLITLSFASDFWLPLCNHYIMLYSVCACMSVLLQWDWYFT